MLVLPLAVIILPHVLFLTLEGLYRPSKGWFTDTLVEFPTGEGESEGVHISKYYGFGDDTIKVCLTKLLAEERDIRL